MDFEPTQDQLAIAEAVEALLAQRAGPTRAIELFAKGGYDAELEAALADAGFLDITSGDETGPLEGVLLVEAIARAAGIVAAGAGTLVAPLVAGHALPRPVALAVAGDASPVRYGAHARTLLLLDGDEARVVPLVAGEMEPVRSAYGYPMGRIDTSSGRGETLGAGSGAALTRWWRVALAAEMVGAMEAALAVTTAYLKERRQFGHPIGSFQAVQHRLAECAIAIEGTRWLTREAAWLGAPEARATTAAAYAAATAQQVFAETHQLSGAIGYTLEHDLHVWSMRLQTLRLEQGGVSAHRRALGAELWGSRA